MQLCPQSATAWRGNPRLLSRACKFSFRHILPRRSAAVSTPPPAAAPPSACCWGRPPAVSTSAPARPQIQFTWHPPNKFRGVQFTSVLNKVAPVLRAEVAVLLAKEAIEPVPPAKMKSGFYSPYFIVPKKGGGLRPILDLHVLNRALHKLPFRMLTQRRIFQCIHLFDWFSAIDWRTPTSMSQTSIDTDRFSALHSKSEHISTRPSASGYPCRLVTSPRLWRQRLFH